ncbi:hypothetical protein [Streptomyces mexicanus]
MAGGGGGEALASATRTRFKITYEITGASGTPQVAEFETYA